MSIREEQCNKVCRILDDVLANRTTERDSLIVAVRKAFESLEQFGNSEQLPSAQPVQWIPCNWHKDTENLPDECKSVLICIKDKIGMYVDVSYRTDYNRWERYGRNVNVVAWRELPEPYKGEQE